MLKKFAKYKNLGPSDMRRSTSIKDHGRISPKMKQLGFPKLLKKYDSCHGPQNASQSCNLTNAALESRVQVKTEFGNFDDTKLIHREIVAARKKVE